MNNSYNFNLIKQCFKFLIPENKRVLYLGIMGDELLPYIKPYYAVCVSDEVIHEFQPEEKFDYIIMDEAIGKTEDISALLSNISPACNTQTRIIIHQRNHLWEGILKLSSKFGLKKKERTQNWLSVDDVRTYLNMAGFETTRTFRKTIFPRNFLFTGTLMNFIFNIIPFFDFLKLDEFIIARQRFNSQNNYTLSLTICITVKDEEHNIQPLVEELPVLCEEQEILFVEGHSTDKTVDEILRMQELYPLKNIRIVKQPGKGQGDAIKTGFKIAHGDIIILYEGDGTSSKSDIQYFYNAMKDGIFEFIEGSRLVYPVDRQSMPLINKIGNVIFARLFSFFLNQRTTDVLSGIKAILKKDFDTIYDTWGFIGINDPFGDFELLFGSARYGLKIGEIPIHYKPRRHGVSKTNVFKHGWYLLRMSIMGYFIFRNSRITSHEKKLTQKVKHITNHYSQITNH